MEILNKIETGQYAMPIVNENKTIPMLWLMMEVANPTLDDMKKAINELELEDKVIVLSGDVFSIQIMKILNSSDPPKAVLAKDITNDEIFIYSYVRKANEQLLKAYKKLRDKYKKLMDKGNKGKNK